MLSNAKHVLSKTVNRVQVGQKMLLSGQELGDCIRIGIERNSQNRKFDLLNTIMPIHMQYQLSATGLFVLIYQNGCSTSCP